MLALEERNEWREQLRQGETPKEIINAVEWYETYRNDSSWRSSWMIEALGEAASYLLELRGIKNSG